MKLFIIGNGFDIGHGLPTGYWDFRSFLYSVQPEFLRSFEEHYYIYPGAGIDSDRIVTASTMDFYDLKDDGLAKRRTYENKF